MKIAIIGQGYVGLPLAMEFSNAGKDVIGFDTDESKIEQLTAGNSYIDDISSELLQELLKSGKYFPTSDESKLSTVDVAIIAVPTPLNSSKEPDLSFIESACEILKRNLKQSTLIVNESTSYPGTLRGIIAKRIQNKDNNYRHYYAISPERVDPGNKEFSIRNTPRIVAGLDPVSLTKVIELYSAICEELVPVSTPEVAEAAKLFENTFRQVNIALVNEFAKITHAMGIPVKETLDAASTKPYGFMRFKPGIGVGGHCIPVDPEYLSWASEKVGVTAQFIKLANQVNSEIPIELVKRIGIEIGGLAGKKILVCGLSYKANISDVRESPSVKLLDELKSFGAKIAWYDPEVSEFSGENSVRRIENSYDAIIICVRHDSMDLSEISYKSNYIFDCTFTIENAITF